jgi:phenylalanine-4-hydroxylase
MAIGKKVISAFSGPADVNSFDLINIVPTTKTIKAKHTDERDELENLYASVRDIRKNKTSKTELKSIFENLKKSHPNDWLLSVEIAELLKDSDEKQLLQEVLVHLDQLKEKRPEIAHLIAGGLDLIFDSSLPHLPQRH